MKLIFNLYQAFTDWLSTSSLLSILGVSALRIDGFKREQWRQHVLPSANVRVTWFHAASVGELEILLPLIHALDERGVALGVSIFSHSALSSLKKLPSSLIYAGFSPRESQWQEFLQHFQVEKVIVSKYEAWPGLWSAISLLSLPLAILNVRPRRSLKWVRTFLKAFGIALPKLYFFATDEKAGEELKKDFTTAQIQVTEDPRWVRVAERAKNALQHPRVAHYQSLHSTRAHPYGMVGSAWMEDLEVVVPAFREGTLWVVPHSLDSENLSTMRRFLDAKIPERYVLIDEMGFLAELYSIADWVWVGGGFGKGIHSTLEPAVFNIPIACGPKNVDEFYETHELRSQGHLTVCATSRQVSDWLESFQVLKPLALDKKIAGFSQLIEQCVQIR